MPKWQEFATAPLHGFKLGLLLKADAANAGLLLGTSAGKDEDGRRLVVIAADIDARDPDVVDTLIRCLPASKMAKVGAVGRTVFLRASPDIKSASFDGEDGRILDLLCAGRQTVVPGSISPVTLAPYRWIGEPVAPDSLPIFTAGDLEVLLETLETVGWKREGRAPVKDRAPFVAADHDPDDLWSETKASALANLSAWVPALDLYGCRPARGGYEAVAHWRASSSGRAMTDRSRNLSVQATGIKDFGTNDTYSAIDLVMSAQDVDQSAATSWLRERLGLDDSGVVIDLRNTENVRIPDDDDLPEPLRGLTAPPQLTTPAVESAREKNEGAVVPAGDVRVAKSAPRGTHSIPIEMPAHLLQVPGLVGEIIDYVTASARKPQRVLALATALTVVGTCGGRRYAGPTGSGTHLYALACAKSGAGKDHGLDMAARLLSAADMTRHIGKGEWMSFQAVYRGLNQQPLTLNPIDELGGFLRRINKRTSGGNEQAITAVLRTAWGKSFKMLPPPGWAGQDMDPIWSPALSILGASTHDDFFKAIEAGDTDNGFLNRWLLFSTQERPPVHKPSADLFEVPASIVDGMLAIYKGGDPLMTATMHHGRCDRPDVVADWVDGEDGALNREYLAWAESLDEASDAESFFARAAEQAIRLATIRAMGCDARRPVIDRECFAWAKEVSLWCANRMLLDAREFMSENQTQGDRAKVVRAIRANSPITHRDLLRKLTTFKTRELEEIIKGLEAAELIRVEPGPPAANNKRSKIYVWLGDQ